MGGRGWAGWGLDGVNGVAEHQASGRAIRLRKWGPKYTKCDRSDKLGRADELAARVRSRCSY